MKKKIKDLTIEQLAKLYGIGCNNCSLHKIDCRGICVTAHDLYIKLKDKDEKVEL